LKFSHFFASTSAQGKWLQMWADKMNTESGGRLKIRIYSSSSLLAQPDCWPGVSKGIADLGYGPRYETFGHDVSIMIGQWEMGCPNNTVAAKIMADAQAAFPEVAKEWAQNKVIINNSHPPANLHNNIREIRSPADLKGLQMRASNVETSTLIQKIGGTPVVMPMSESYQALQKNTVQGIMSPIEVLENFRLGEVVKYTSSVYLYFSPEFPLYMNWDTWNGLPKDLQDIITKNVPWAQDDSNIMWAGIDESAVKWCDALPGGHKWAAPLSAAELEAFYSLVRPWHISRAAELDAKGLPGTKVMQFVQDKVKAAAAAK